MSGGAALGRIPLLAKLPTDDLDLLEAAASTRSLEDGEALFVAGEAADALFGVVHGQIVLRASGDGRSTIVMTSGAGEVLGWSALREDARWLTTGRSVGHSEVVVVPVDAMLALLGSGSPAAGALVRELFGLAARHLAETQAQLLRRGSEGPITGG